MRHKDTAALREFLKGYREADEKDIHPTDQQERLPMPPMEVRRGGEIIELPERDVSPLGAMLENRYSLRSYGGGPLTLEELSFLLWAAQGVKAVNQYRTLRTAPSGGARHPLELYAFVNNVAGLAPGAYHYLALEDKLERLGCRANQADQLTFALAGQEFAGHAPVCLVWTAVPYRSEWRYDSHGHKDILLDAGHSCQNVYLACEELGLGCCALAAYDQAAMDELLGLSSEVTDSREAEFTVYACCAGRPR
ncbi:MAG: SagB/ThcOx family dehydrogenase [Oscillospiraceae bacterium]|jgi:SagB-type dehydrogenase family enzyme|nr:SagB/ThcOx family dehydrogenase [Oscillospiraceae bacterium]